MILLKIKSNGTTSYIKPTKKNSRKDNNYFKLQEATSVVSEGISRRKKEYQNHLALKLSDPMTNVKTYWSLLKT